MHPARGVELTHRRINNRVSRVPCLPGLQMCRIILPLHAIGPTDKRLMPTQRRMVSHQMTIKFTPDKFVQPDAAFPSFKRLRLLREQSIQALARRQSPVARLADNRLVPSTAGKSRRCSYSLAACWQNWRNCAIASFSSATNRCASKSCCG